MVKNDSFIFTLNALQTINNYFIIQVTCKWKMSVRCLCCLARLSIIEFFHHIHFTEHSDADSRVHLNTFKRNLRPHGTRRPMWMCPSHSLMCSSLTVFRCYIRMACSLQTNCSRVYLEAAWGKCSHTLFDWRTPAGPYNQNTSSFSRILTL